MELLNKALNGWQEYKGSGKLTAILLIVLFAVWLLKTGEKKQKILWQLSLVTAVLCIFPVTAALLMGYQTKFYDYQWIWSVVPQTAMIACGSVLLLKQAQDMLFISRWKWGLLGAGILCLVLLCGRLDNPRWAVRDTGADRQNTRELILEINKKNTGSSCLLAPEEIMEQVRSVDATIQLPYGRNMWQEHLNAWLYDSYTLEQRDLYVWMAMASRVGHVNAKIQDDLKVVGEASPEGTFLYAEEQIACARSLGVNCFAFPGYIYDEDVQQLSEILGTEPVMVAGYYLFCTGE